MIRLKDKSNSLFMASDPTHCVTQSKYLSAAFATKTTGDACKRVADRCPAAVTSAPDSTTRTGTDRAAQNSSALDIIPFPICVCAYIGSMILFRLFLFHAMNLTESTQIYIYDGYLVPLLLQRLEADVRT
jgi:hypothetical protein